MKHLNEISEEGIVNLNIPTGIPFMYELDIRLQAIRHQHFADSDKVLQAIQCPARQGKAPEWISFHRRRTK